MAKVTAKLGRAITAPIRRRLRGGLVVQEGVQALGSAPGRVAGRGDRAAHREGELAHLLQARLVDERPVLAADEAAIERHHTLPSTTAPLRMSSPRWLVASISATSLPFSTDLTVPVKVTTSWGATGRLKRTLMPATRPGSPR